MIKEGTLKYLFPEDHLIKHILEKMKTMDRKKLILVLSLKTNNA